jgi:serine/threonine protein kinase
MSRWWTDERIQATVTRSYISKHLPPQKQLYLHRPLPFGQGLTDDTYGDWIYTRGQRLYLLLQEIGCCEKIFEFAERSIDDSDLPLTENDIAALKLPSAGLAKKFYQKQHAFKVQTLKEGVHIDYAGNDVIPVRVIPRGVGGQSRVDKDSFDRVTFSAKEFTRRRISLRRDSGIEKSNFIHHFKTLQQFKHPHLISVFATYTHEEQGYVLLGPSPELTLKSVLEDPSKYFKQMPKTDQLDLLLRWAHCLIRVVGYMHEHEMAHQAIRPSNIFITSDYNVMLGPYAALGALEDRDPIFKLEAYEHAAPEQWQRRSTWQETIPLRSSLQSGSRAAYQPKYQRQSSRPSSPETSRTASAGSSGSSLTTRTSNRYSRVSSTGPSLKSSAPTNSARPSHAIITTLTYQAPTASTAAYDQTPLFPSDIFCLSTVVIQLLSLFVSIHKSTTKYSPSSLRSHLGKCNRNAGRGGAPADCSFHSNLLQVNTWLDALSQAMLGKSGRKLPKLLSKSGASSKSNPEGEDPNSTNYRTALDALIEIARQGTSKEPASRFLATDCVMEAKEIFSPWRGSSGACICLRDIEVIYGVNPETPRMSASDLPQPIDTVSGQNRRQRAVDLEFEEPLVSPLTPASNPLSDFDEKLKLVTTPTTINNAVELEATSFDKSSTNTEQYSYDSQDINKIQEYSQRRSPITNQLPPTMQYQDANYHNDNPTSKHWHKASISSRSSKSSSASTNSNDHNAKYITTHHDSMSSEKIIVDETLSPNGLQQPRPLHSTPTRPSPATKTHTYPYRGYDSTSPYPYPPPSTPLPPTPLRPVPTTTLPRLSHAYAPSSATESMLYELAGSAVMPDVGYESQTLGSEEEDDFFIAKKKSSKKAPAWRENTIKREENLRDTQVDSDDESVVIALDGYQWPKPEVERELETETETETETEKEERTDLNLGKRKNATGNIKRMQTIGRGWKR